MLMTVIMTMAMTLIMIMTMIKKKKQPVRNELWVVQPNVILVFRVIKFPPVMQLP